MNQCHNLLNKVYALTFVASLLFSGCSRSGNDFKPESAQGDRTNQQAVDAKTPLDAEAEQYLRRELIEKYFLKIGDSHYTKYCEPGDRKKWVLVQMKEVKIAVDPGGLSETDKMNDISWWGRVSLVESAARTLELGAADPAVQPRWSDWMGLVQRMGLTSLMRCDLERKKGV